MSDETLVDQFVRYLKNRPLIAGAVVVAMFVTAVTQLVSAIVNLPPAILKAKQALSELGLPIEAIVPTARVLSIVVMLYLGIYILFQRWLWHFVIGAFCASEFLFFCYGIFKLSFLETLVHFVLFLASGSLLQYIERRL